MKERRRGGGHRHTDGRTDRQDVWFPLRQWRKRCRGAGVWERQSLRPGGGRREGLSGSVGRRRPPWQDAGKGDCGKLHGIRVGRLMPSSSGTFSSRNRAVGQAQREHGREEPQPTLYSGSPGLNLPSPLWHFLQAEQPPGGRGGRGWSGGEDADERQPRRLSSDWRGFSGTSAAAWLLCVASRKEDRQSRPSERNNEDLISAPSTPATGVVFKNWDQDITPDQRVEIRPRFGDRDWDKTE